MLIEYRCIRRTFYQNALRDPGDIILCDPEVMQAVKDPCFVPVNPEAEHIEVKKEKAPASPKPQTRKRTTT